MMEKGETGKDAVMLTALARFGSGYIDFLQSVAWGVTCAQTRGTNDLRYILAGPDPEDERKVAEAATNLAWFSIFDVGEGYCEPIHPFFTIEFVNSYLKQAGDPPRQESDTERARDFEYATSKYPGVIEDAVQKLNGLVLNILGEVSLDEKQKLQLVCGGFLSMANNYFDFEPLSGSGSEETRDVREYFYNTIITSALTKYSSMQ